MPVDENRLNLESTGHKILIVFLQSIVNFNYPEISRDNSGCHEITITEKRLKISKMKVLQNFLINVYFDVQI